jgi:probable rRNA maturation factor
MNTANPDSPSFTVDISINDPAWEKLDFNVVEIAEITVRETLFCAEFSPEKGSEVSILLANDDLIRTLNREYRGKDKPTNVLSFPTEEEGHGAPLGDIILSLQTITEEAENQLKLLKDHFMHLLVHGTLHLMGHDHEDDEQADDMENMEIWVLQRLGVKNPYLRLDNL